VNAEFGEDEIDLVVLSRPGATFERRRPRPRLSS
jgi:hypothetical protein